MRIGVLVLEVLEQPAAIVQQFDKGCVGLLEEQASDDRDIDGEGAVRQNGIDDRKSV